MEASLLTTGDQLQGIAHYWHRWQNHPNNEYDLFQEVIKSRPEIVCPYVVLVRHNGEPAALLLGRMELIPLPARIGYLRLGRRPCRVLTILHEGLLGNPDADVVGLMLNAIGSSLRRQGVSVLWLHGIRDNSLLHRQLSARKCPGLRPVFCPPSIHRTMKVPSKPGAFLSSMRSKHRTWIKKKSSDLDSCHPGLVLWRTLKAGDDLLDFCDQMEKVAEHSYQRGLGAGFINNEEHRRRYARLAAQGCLRIWLLQIGDKPIAYWAGTLFDKTYHSEVTSYDSQFREYEVGTLTFVRMVDDLASEAVERLDFGLGDAAYKQRFGDEAWNEQSVFVPAKSLRGALAVAQLGLSVASTNAAKSMLRNAGILDRVRTAWRKRIAKRLQG